MRCARSPCLSPLVFRFGEGVEREKRSSSTCNDWPRRLCSRFPPMLPSRPREDSVGFGTATPGMSYRFRCLRIRPSLLFTLVRQPYLVLPPILCAHVASRFASRPALTLRRRLLTTPSLNAARSSGVGTYGLDSAWAGQACILSLQRIREDSHLGEERQIIASGASSVATTISASLGV